jgi:hypothetical protein
VFVFACILFVVAALVFLASRFLGVDDSGTDLKKGARGIGWIVLAVALIFTAFASISTVPTRNVGIVTAFNKPTGRTTGAGIQFTLPWQSIDEWDASRNTFDRLGGNCLWVSVSGGRACIAVQVEWSAKDENAPQDWASYKEDKNIEGGRFGTFVHRRVTPQIDGAITTVFTTFNPLGQVDEKTGALKAPDLNAEYKDKLLEQLQANLGNSITIDSIAFGTPSYDEPTTNAISAFGQKTLEARNLKVDEANAETRKRITEIDAKVDPTARCLSIAEKLNKEPGLCMTSATITRPVNP